MESYLKEINTVLGVLGSFVCATDGKLIAQAMPDKVDSDRLTSAARVTSQTLQALDASGLRVAELDLAFEHERVILKVLRGGVLGILCARNINLPLLNLTLNVVAKKIAAGLKPPKPQPAVGSAATQPPEQNPPAPSPSPAPAAAPIHPPMPSPVVIPSSPIQGTTPPSSEPVPLAQAPVAMDKIAPPLFVELSQEIQRVLQDARRYRLDLRAMDSIAIWLCTSYSRALLSIPDRREIMFAGRSVQSDAITLLFQHVGYKDDARFNAFFGNRRLRFTRTDCDLTAQVIVDTFTNYHRLDLAGCFTEERSTIPETDLLLTRLQQVEISDSALREICALLLEHDLSVGVEKDKIDASQITKVCVEDWGWFKTVSINLDRVISFSTATLGHTDRATVIERVQKIRNSMNSAPKSLRWQTRARLGETVRWYETPVEYKGHARPDMAMG